MEITRQRFLKDFPIIQSAVEECDFMAIDTELTGLHRPGTSRRLDTLANRYSEYREATERFSITQFGLCTFKWDEPSGQYFAKPFNFYIFPRRDSRRIQTPDRLFMIQSSAFDFLAGQGFDFNKWVYQGIPYLTFDQEKAFVAAAERKMKNDFADIPIDDKELGFMSAAREKIDAWLAGNQPEDEDGANITTYNAYQRRLIYQEVRNKYKDLVAEGRSGFIRVVRKSDKQKDPAPKPQTIEGLDLAVGFRRVIECISESGKPVVGHNMLLDMCHVIGQFLEPLPQEFDDFKKLIHRLFPIMVDTKHICYSAPELKDIFGAGTALETLRSGTSRKPFINPRIEMPVEFPRYLLSEMQHEAGFDAYATGSVFLKFISYLDLTRNPRPPSEELPEEETEEEPKKAYDEDGWEISDEEDQGGANWENDVAEVHNYGSTKVPVLGEDNKVSSLVKQYTNKIVMERTAYRFFDAANAEPIVNQSNTFHIRSKQKPAVELQGLVENCFSKYGRCFTELIDDGSMYLVFEAVQSDPQQITANAINNSDFTVQTVADYLVSTALKDPNDLAHCGQAPVPMLIRTA